MSVELTAAQQASQHAFRRFVRDEIAPHADRWDREERMPREVIARLAKLGYLGALHPRRIMAEPSRHDHVRAAERGAGARLLLGPQPADRPRDGRSTPSCGGGAMRSRTAGCRGWPAGEVIGAFGLTEPGTGSDANSIETSARPTGGSYVLDGAKVWTTFGQIADVYLIFAQQEGQICTFLVERDRAGIRGHADDRSTRDARVDAGHAPTRILRGPQGEPGRRRGLRPERAWAPAALDIGRYSVACGSVGIAQACLDASHRLRRPSGSSTARPAKTTSSSAR